MKLSDRDMQLRTRELRDPTFGMRRTSRHVAADNPIDTSEVWPTAARQDAISFAVVVERTATGSNGVIFELGGFVGTAAWIDGADVSFCAGGDGDNGLALTLVGALAVGQRGKFIFGCSAGDGRAWVWMDGVQWSFGQCVDQSFGGGWSGLADGAIGEPFGAVNPYVPGAQAVPLVDALIVGAMDVYLHQLPKGVHRG